MRTLNVAMVICLVLLGAFACGGVGDQGSPPTITEVHVRVFWSTPEEIAKRCQPGQIACSLVGTPQNPTSTIWIQKPAGFADREGMYTLGHEFFHALGANHP